jgi:uncharacterized repeat protein (TIGR03803 family)
LFRALSFDATTLLNQICPQVLDLEWSCTMRSLFLLLACLATAIASSAQTFSTVANFYTSDGEPQEPFWAILAQGLDGFFYATAQGGSHGNTVYGVSTTGDLYRLYQFGENPNDPQSAYDGLTLGVDGNFYGTAPGGGANAQGAVYKITISRELTLLYSFCSVGNCTDGAQPQASLILGGDGNFYGTTAYGGNKAPSGCGTGCGTIFKITPTGELTTLYRFCSKANCADGSQPFSGLVQGSDGNFYGTTSGGGASSSCDGGCGTVFKLTPNGALTTLHSFCSQSGCTDGVGPYKTGLIQATDGNFYGTTYGGGTKGFNGGGTIFKITPSGQLTTLYSFCSLSNCLDGDKPTAPYMLQATDGKIYGTTAAGGLQSESADVNCFGCGTIYEITTSGEFKSLYDFCGESDCLDGGQANAGLTQGTDGKLYGTTQLGGKNESGTVFSLALGVPPFLKFLPADRLVGDTVIILGQGFEHATTVSFNGTAASFKVESNTHMTATVPAGATTGDITITEPGGTLHSQYAFHVLPTTQSFVPNNGPVGTLVTIHGMSLTQTTSVSFGGVPATSFNVVSDTELQATVPEAAETGYIEITTTGGSFTTCNKFYVTP